MNRFLAFLAALLLAAPVLAKGDVKATSAPLAPPTLRRNVTKWVGFLKLN